MIFVCGLAGIFVIFVDNVVNVLIAFDSVHAPLWNKYLMKWIAVMFPQNVQLHKINIKRLFFIKQSKKGLINFSAIHLWIVEYS